MLATLRTTTRNPFMPHRAYGAGGFHGQFANVSEKHREGKPSTETGRGRADLDVSAYDGTRGADRLGMPESGGRSCSVARDGCVVLWEFQELLCREPPSGVRSLRGPPRLRELVRLVLRPSKPRPDGDRSSGEIRRDVRGREGSRRQGVREDAEERRRRDWLGHPGADEDIRIQLREMESDGRGGQRCESGAAGVAWQSRRRPDISTRRRPRDRGQRDQVEVPPRRTRAEAVR